MPEQLANQQAALARIQGFLSDSTERVLIGIIGKPGAGKSTLMAALMKRGFTLFSDDVCVPVSGTSEGVFMHSSYPMMKF